MTRARIQLLLLLLLCGVTFFVNSGALEANIMEARNLTTAREMLAKGNWLEPTMNGELRFEKPPLPTWAAALAMKAFGAEDLALLRLPAGLAALLLVLFLYALTRELTRDAEAPFLAAATAATSFYVFFMARDISWDIFCHAFMLGAIWQLHRGLERPGRALAPFVWAGLLMGLSFLSKGPVAFFALLLPYLAAHVVARGFAPLRAHGGALLACAAITVAMSAAWPIYIYLSHPDASTYVAQKESSAWLNRHTRSFFNYWSFPVQSGVWALLATAALVAPYARRRVARFGDYTLLTAWVWIGVLLLSLFPEKKERYLLPVLLPLAMLTALQVRALVQAFREDGATRADEVLVRVHAGLMALVGLAAPVVAWAMIRRNGFPASPLVTAASVAAFWGVAAFLVRAGWRKEPLAVWGGTVALVAVACALGLVQARAVVTTNPRYRPYAELRQRADLAGVPFFRDADVHGKFIEVVWASGREIGYWDPRQRPEPPVPPPLVLMTREPPADVLGAAFRERYAVEELGRFDADQGRWGGSALQNHVLLVRPRAAITPARDASAR